MKTILGKEIGNKKDYEEAYKIEADVIVTAVALGFIGTRYHLNQPCIFGDEEPPQKDIVEGDSSQEISEKEKESLLKARQEYQRFQKVLEAMSIVLGEHNKDMVAHLKGLQSPQWEQGALITGRSGGHMLHPDYRHRKMLGEVSTRFAKLVAEKPDKYEVYAGKGAYTGMIDDPVNDEVMI